MMMMMNCDEVSQKYVHIVAFVTVGRLEVRGEIIRTVLCCKILCTEVVHSHKHTWMSSSYSPLWIRFYHTGPISPCVDSFVFVFLFCVLFIMHNV